MPYISQQELASLSYEQHKSLFILGYDPQTSDIFYVPHLDRYAGCYILGVQGSGKSGLLQNLINADMQAGNAVIVIDPHGDLADACLGLVPGDRLSHTFLLDMEDEAYPFGVNVFSTGRLDTELARTQAVERIMHVFGVLWPDVMSQANLPRYLRAATITLLANPGSTLVDMYTFLSDQACRARLLSNVADPTVQQFWQMQYDALSQHEHYQRVLPLIGRLETLFMGRSLIRNIVGQRHNTISFRRAIENKQIIFIKLSPTIPQDAKLVGTILLSQIQAAIFSFADTQVAGRSGVSLYADEFQHFATEDFSKLLTEGRKFGVRLTIAHQHRSQVPNFLQASTMTTRTKVCFRLTPDDSREMAHLFPAQETEIKPEDIDAQASKTLLIRASDYGPVVERFVDLYLAPLQGYRHGRQIEVANGGLDMRAVLRYGAINVGNMPNVIVDDPTPYLDRLLYDVMRSGNYNQLIPWEIPLGFSNGGSGFFAAARAAKEAELTATIMPLRGFPQHLLVPTADGDVEWPRQPRTGKEWLWHFLFSLRSLMFLLAQHPIGKESSASTADVAKWLIGLQNRWAYVNSADAVGTIYTFNTVPIVASARQAIAQQIEYVRQQTRQTYCRPRTDVEREILQSPCQSAPPNQPQPPSAPPDQRRWEEY